MKRSGIVIAALGTLLALGAGRNANAMTWTETFDDGNIVDWTVENPYDTHLPITLGVSTEQSVSPTYSLKVSGPNTNDFGAQAWGPQLFLDWSRPFTIKFKFRYSSFHWYHVAALGPVSLTMDQPSLPLRYNFANSDFRSVGTQSFSSYCPANTWTEFRIEVRPATHDFDVYVGGVNRGTVSYDPAFDTGNRFFVREDGEIVTQPDYVTSAYYDDLTVTQTQPLLPAFPAWGIAVLVIALLGAATLFILRGRSREALA